MKVVYVARNGSLLGKLESGKADFIALLSDNWDDYTYKTTFRTRARLDGHMVDLGDIKVLLDGFSETAKQLNELLKAEEWNGLFPIPTLNYISVPSDIRFFQQIIGSCGAEVAGQVAELLRDASFQCRIKLDDAALGMTKLEGFDRSLQREPGAVKAFVDGWRVHNNTEIVVSDANFEFKSVRGNSLLLKLKFSPHLALPSDINVVIGPNGVGKSQFLHSLIATWLGAAAKEKGDSGSFQALPNFSQLIVVGYSPFERFPLRANSEHWRDSGAYRYFGLRMDGGGAGEDIRLSRTVPKIDAARSLINCLEDDQRYSSIKSWSNKLRTMSCVLNTAFSFDYAAVRVKDGVKPNRYLRSEALVDDLIVSVDEDGARKKYLVVHSPAVDEYLLVGIKDAVVAEEGVAFFKGGRLVRLSSGQRLFSYMVMCVLGSIRNNSLILVDEPEIFLHPTLEIEFLRMLKSILLHYKSKAILATHSLVAVRETPRHCVHVFEETLEEEIRVTQPPFQTFGSDVQRISSYVFGDKSVDKPYRQWLRERSGELGSPQALIEKLGDEINEEMHIYLSALEVKS